MHTTAANRSHVMNRINASLLLLAALFFSVPVAAEQSKTFGDYTIHYSAFPSDLLTPEVARNYKITRSKSRAILNISVLKKNMGTTGQPVKSKVEAIATNLSQQLREVELREIQVENAIYYLGQVRVSNGETLEFELNITPEGESAALNFKFRQKFFTE